MKNPKKQIKDSKSRIAFNILNYVFFTLLIILCFYPLWYVLIQSLSGSHVAGKGLLLPYHPTLMYYFEVFKMEGVFEALGVSVARTVAGTLVTLFNCMLLGYLFSKQDMPFRKTMYRIVTITMYVSGGLIPGYLVSKAYGLLNTFWIYIIPGISAYYIILIKTYIEQLPAAVEESAMLDGAGPFSIFLRIILPMSLPIAATIAVYASVGHWNAWFDNHIYNFQNPHLTTIQYKLYKLLNEADELAKQMAQGNVDDSQIKLTPTGVRMTVTMVTVLPVMMIYPFLQRFFIKGIMIGAVKG